MAYTHDLVFIGPGAHDEIGIVERFAFDDEAVIARGLEWIGHTAEHALAVVMNGRSLAVHHSRVTHHLAAKNVADALVAETDAQDRRRRGEAFQHFIRDAGLARCTRPR